MRVQPDAVLTGPPVNSIDELPERLAAIDQALPPTDGLACFNRMYRLVTASVKQHVGAGFFADPGWIAQLDIVFGNVYLDAVEPLEEEEAAGDDTVDEVAWKTAVESAPWLLGSTPPEREVPPEELFEKLQPFKELVADDIRDGEQESDS